MEIKSLSQFSPDKLFQTFEQAFVDYEVQIDKQAFLALLRRRGFEATASFGAFEADKLVSFTLNGIGTYNGIPTAYDTGTGTLKEYRGRKLSTQVFEYALPQLKALGMQAYLLEVLQHNKGAYSVYQKLGFEVSREFYYFFTDTQQIKYSFRPLGFDYTLRPIQLNKYRSISNFWDFKPSWQNSLEAINRDLENFSCLGVFSEDKLLGYGVLESSSGDLTQLAVDKAYRGKGIGSILFHQLIEMNKQSTLKIVNTDIQCESITNFLRAKNITPSGKQFEMMKKLGA